MNVTCESCGAHYRIPMKKITRDVSRANCKKCGASITVRRPDATDEHTELLASDDEAVVNHNEDRTVITHVPELKDFQVTPVLEASAFSSAGIPVRVARGVAQSGKSSSAAVPDISTSSRIEAGLFSMAVRDSEAVVTMEAEESSPMEDTIEVDQAVIVQATQRHVPLPAGARMVAEMPKQATVEVTMNIPSSKEPITTPPPVREAPMLAATQSGPAVPPEVRKAMSQKAKKTGPGVPATSMHMGLTAQYEAMKNGLPPGFTSPPIQTRTTNQNPIVAKTTSMGASKVPMQTANVAAPVPTVPKGAERMPKFIAGTLSLLALCSVVLLIVQGP